MNGATPVDSAVIPAGFIEPCNPTVSKTAPSGPQWIHEIKHDGFRLIVRRQDGRLRVFTRRGFDWTKRYPAIVEAVNRLRVRSIMIGGEAVYFGEDGQSDFDKLHSQAHNSSVFLFAFDVLEMNGEDTRVEPLEKRKARLQKLLANSAREFSTSNTWKGRGRSSSSMRAT